MVQIAYGLARAGRLPFMLLVAVAVSACGGSSGSSNSQADSDDDGPSAPAPTLSFSASPTTVSAGGDSTLTWNAANASGCDASGGWSGARGVSGSENVGPIDSDTTYRLSCSGTGGGVSREVTVSVDDGSGPTVDLDADPTEVAVNGTSTLTWSSQNATSCTASGAWSGSQALSGTFTTGPLGSSATFTLSCSGASGNAMASVTVQVLDKVLRWQAPTQNVDGTQLTDLAGFFVYWGGQSRNYGSNFQIADPNATQWTADIAPGTYFFEPAPVGPPGTKKLATSSSTANR